MAVTVDQINAWRTVPSENQNLEFKEAKDSFSKTKLAEYCVAISNERGGHLLLGIGDRPPRPIVGTNAFPGTIDVSQWLLDKAGFRVDVEEVLHPDGRVLVFSIPSRPLGVPRHLDGKYLMRSGSSTVPMSEEHLRKIFAESESDWFEKSAMRNLGDQEIIDLLDTQTFFELIEKPYPANRADVLEHLKGCRLIDRSGRAYQITRLGGILLAKNLNGFPDLSGKAPRVVVYSGSSKLTPRLDQVGNHGYAVAFQNLVEFVMNQLPQNEGIQDALRQNARLLPEEIIRELIANALIHQDFTIRGARPMIEIYDNRVEISNPGKPLLDVERFIDEFQTRNERLVELARRMRICEVRGSGIDRVLQATETFQLPAPDFRTDSVRTTVTIFGPKTFEDMNREDRVRACYQHCALRLVGRQEAMTNRSLRERFGLPEGKRESTVVSQVISAAIELGQIKADPAATGSRKFARYLPFWG